ncbi:NAD(P)-binding domain-containing protein [Promicromonospora sp. NPDC050880]|uniref:RraA family protein n=1 Tax=Promicromonospora sp. NPDC050880 TaxID=3364406 RepID=UPI0037AA70D9
MRLAVLGLGEAGTIYAQGFTTAGAEVAGFDPGDTATPPGVRRAGSVGDAVAGADLVISLVTAAHAVDVAREAAPALAPEALYADLNAASPELKHEVAAALGGASGRFADVAVIGSVPQNGPRTSLLVSGPATTGVASSFRELGAPVEAMGGDPGDATRRKILRSVFMKGLGAVITEAIDAGVAAGEEAWVRDQITAELAGGRAAAERLDLGTRKHAVRRSHESAAAAGLLSSLGVNPVVTTAAAERHRYLGQFAGEAPDRLEDLLAAYSGVPTAAIGDARDRLGVVDPRVRTMWPGAHVAGRALTVLCRPGDNQGIHQALTVARPGDVLVVDGGGHPARALIGELIAHRAVNRGIAGMIIDGAVRDVPALQEARFPVWAVGSSPAGPYKSGPYRIGTAVSVGGAVVHPGDVVVADADGVIVVPLAEAARTLAGARAVLADEAARYRTILGERPA